MLKHLRRSQTLHGIARWEYRNQGHELMPERLCRVQVKTSSTQEQSGRVEVALGSCAVSIHVGFQDLAG